MNEETQEPQGSFWESDHPWITELTIRAADHPWITELTIREEDDSLDEVIRYTLDELRLA